MSPLKGAPDGALLPARATDGTLRVLDGGVGQIVNLSEESQGPLEWVRVQVTEAVLARTYRGGYETLAFWHLNGTVEAYYAPMVEVFLSPTQLPTWAVWPDGRFLSLSVPYDDKTTRIFASDNYGRNATLLSHAAEPLDGGIAANPLTGEFGTFGGSSQVTFWRANGTPYAQFKEPDECNVPARGYRSDCIGAFAWIGPDAAAIWNSVRAKLYR